MLPAPGSICRCTRCRPSSGPSSATPWHAQGLLAEIPAAVWEIDWNVNCQAVGSGEATLKYLARYVFKVAISDQPHRALR